MFKFLILILAVSIFSCNNPFKLVYTNDGTLARLQDSLVTLYNRGEVPVDSIIRDLKINWWVAGAYKTAPSNLVLRQYCLIDLFDLKSNHSKKIERMISLLSDSSSFRTWAEGYSYWLYTKSCLVPWLDKFKNDISIINIKKAVDAIDAGFALTSYERNGIYYPAPYADLWDIPLDSIGQDIAEKHIYLDSIVIGQVSKTYTKDTVVYNISAKIVGLNGHTIVHNQVVHIVDGKPIDFKYYQGYDNKYHDAKAEWTDLLNPIRLITIPFIW